MYKCVINYRILSKGANFASPRCRGPLSLFAKIVALFQLTLSGDAAKRQRTSSADFPDLPYQIMLRVLSSRSVQKFELVKFSRSLSTGSVTMAPIKVRSRLSRFYLLGSTVQCSFWPLSGALRLSWKNSRKLNVLFFCEGTISAKWQRVNIKPRGHRVTHANLAENSMLCLIIRYNPQ